MHTVGVIAWSFVFILKGPYIVVFCRWGWNPRQQSTESNYVAMQVVSSVGCVGPPGLRLGMRPNLLSKEFCILHLILAQVV